MKLREMLRHLLFLNQDLRGNQSMIFKHALISYNYIQEILRVNRVHEGVHHRGCISLWTLFYVAEAIRRRRRSLLAGFFLMSLERPAAGGES